MEKKEFSTTYERKLIMKFLLSILGMTNQCNLNCSYCDWEKDKYREITDKEYDNVEKYLLNIKQELDKRYPELILIEYSGGETLLYPQIIKILLSVFCDKWIRINTNGINISEEILFMIKEHGKVFVALSLDSYNLEGNFPRFKNNKNLLELVISNLEKTLEYNVPVYLLCTINKYNIEYFPEYIEFLQHKFGDYIERAMLAMPAHFVTNYEKENGIPSKAQISQLKEYLAETDNPLIRKNYFHYKELEYYFINNNRYTACSIPDWSLSIHYRKESIIVDGRFISFGCGMRGIYELGSYDSMSCTEINKYFDIASDKKITEHVLSHKSSSSFAYGCQEMCFTDWVCFDMIMQGKISLDDASKWFVFFQDPSVKNLIINYQHNL